VQVNRDPCNLRTHFLSDAPRLRRGWRDVSLAGHQETGVASLPAYSRRQETSTKISRGEVAVFVRASEALQIRSSTRAWYTGLSPGQRLCRNWNRRSSNPQGATLPARLRLRIAGLTTKPNLGERLGIVLQNQFDTIYSNSVDCAALAVLWSVKGQFQ